MLCDGSLISCILTAQVKGRQTVMTRAGFREDTTLGSESRRSSITSHTKLPPTPSSTDDGVKVAG